MDEYSAFSQRIDNNTVTAAQAGDRNAMRVLYESLYSGCFKLVFRLTANKSTSEDLVQNGFVKVLTKLSSFEHQGSFSGWVRKIMVNETLAFLRSNTNKAEAFTVGDDAHQETEDEQSEISTITFLGNDWWEACNDLSVLTAALDDNSRAVLILHEIEGYSHKEIAAVFDKTESFSKQVLARTMSKLKERIQQEGPIDASKR
jgi:RNA polymerase sigma-70 factor (ECF subfamily)